MRARAAWCVLLVASLTGCVQGYGRCLFVEPVKSTLRGTLHFRSYPAGDGVDHVPVLSLDRTAHVYSPAQSFSCFTVNDVQLVGWTEYPPDLPENSHVTVEGSLFEAASEHEHTRFLMNVRTITPIMTLPPAKP